MDRKGCEDCTKKDSYTLPEPPPTSSAFDRLPPEERRQAVIALFRAALRDPDLEDDEPSTATDEPMAENPCSGCICAQSGFSIPCYGLQDPRCPLTHSTPLEEVG
jgi:hypothetical protein